MFLKVQKGQHIHIGQAWWVEAAMTTKQVEEGHLVKEVDTDGRFGGGQHCQHPSLASRNIASGCSFVL
jgi:hypothetical protein